MFKVLLLNIRKTYSDSDYWETNCRVSPFKGDQHHNHWTASIRAFSSYLQKYWSFYIRLLDISLHRIIISIQYPLIYTIWWLKLHHHLCSVRVNEGDARFHLPHTHREARVTLAVTSECAVSLNEDIHEQHLQNCSESHFMSILPFDLSKTSIISYSHRNVTVFTTTRQNKFQLNLEDTVAEIY